jgi:diazepam-binding inhibitor (GABA receptor modulating acyl-CoA-binding protein)
MPNSPQFLQAAEAVKNLQNRPDNDTLGQLYGLFKQATVGDNDTDQPGMLDFKGSAKWKSWNSYRGLSTYKAEVQYITLVNSLLARE